jgi:hypothetical protein
MKSLFLPLATVGLLCATGAIAQMPDTVQRSSSPSGISIQGDTAVRAQAQSTAAVAVGEHNTTKSGTGAVQGSVNIRGNTRIDAQAREVNAVAVGKDNKANNAVGAIGGN